MFREGQYLEVIKASDDCLATAIVTVKERIIEIEKKKVSTNKWLTIQDWSSLYDIITKALLKSIKICRDDDNKIKSLERKKSTKTLDVIYKFEAGDESSLPTIKVRVCQAKKTLNKQNVNDKKAKKNYESSKLQVERLMEEQKSLDHDKYIPPELTNEKNNNLKYIPSRKSLLNTKYANDEYTPSSEKKLLPHDVSYVTKNLNKKINNKSTNDGYNPTTTTTTTPAAATAAQFQEEKDNTSYTPHSISTLKIKNKKSNIYETTDEYIPNVILSNDEYVPSGGQSPNDGPSYVPNLISDLSNSNDKYIPTIDVNRLNKKTNYSQDKNKKIKKNRMSEILTDLSNDEYTPKAVCELPNNGVEYVPDLLSNESKKDEANDEYIPKSLNETTKTTTAAATDDSVEYVPDFLLNKKTKNSINQSVIDEAEQPDEYIPTSEIKLSKNKYSSSSTSKKRKKKNYESVIDDTSNDEYIPTSKPCKLTTDLSPKYIPSLKNSNSSSIVHIEEYEPNFATNKNDFNLSYVPSSTKIQNDEYIPLKKKIRKAHEPKDSTKRLLLLKKKNILKE